MNITESLPHQERPAFLVIFEEPMHHIIVLWGIEKLPLSYIVTFSRHIIAGDPRPTIVIDNEWWNLKDHPVPSQLTTAFDIKKILSEDTGVLQAVTGTETAHIPQACIVPLVLAPPLLAAPYLSPADA